MTKVKICGLSTPEAVQTAVEAGADYIGFVFAPSKRQVTLEQARQLAIGIPERVQKVGVFVSPQREEVEKACQVVGLDLIQVHGSMDDAILQELPQQTIRAVQVLKEANGICYIIFRQASCNKEGLCNVLTFEFLPVKSLPTSCYRSIKEQIIGTGLRKSCIFPHLNSANRLL